MTTTLSNKHYAATEENKTPGKIWRIKSGKQVSGTAGERWRRQHREMDGKKSL